MPQIVSMRKPPPTERETVLRILRDLLYQIEPGTGVTDAEKISYLRSKISFLISYLDRAR
jgi:hypothetical protein